MNKKITTFILISIIVGAGSISAFSLYKLTHKNYTTVVSSILAKLTPEEIINQSDGIIIGTVDSLETFEAPSEIKEGREDIFTSISISIEKFLFNPKNLDLSNLTIKTIGGTIGNKSMFLEDGPSFKEGDRVVIFLRQKEDGSFIIFGGPQGKYTIDDSNNIAKEDREKIFLQDVFEKDTLSVNELEVTIDSFVSSSEK